MKSAGNTTPLHLVEQTANVPTVVQDWYRAEDRCKRLGGITTKTMYDWIASRGLPKGRKLGPRVVVYSRVEDDAWIANQPMSDAGNLGRTGLSRSACAKQQRAAEASARTVSALETA